MKRYLLILRGLPGSGKTTYALKVAEKFNSLYKAHTTICSADHFFIDASGNYIYDRDSIGQAHEFCRECAEEAMINGSELVIIDNTNTTKREFHSYVKMAQFHGYIVREKLIGDCDLVKEYHSRCIHNVPLINIEKMANRLKNSLQGEK